MTLQASTLWRLLDKTVGSSRTSYLFQALEIYPALLDEQGDSASRATISQALNMLLFESLLGRVPTAKLYAEDCIAAGKPITHDHGAVRTVALEGMGGLPAGSQSILRLLEPLGYKLNGTYPLDRIKMLGRSYVQEEFPEQIGQFFISELYPDRFTPEFQAAVLSVTSKSVDPLTPEAAASLAALDESGSLPIDEAAKLLPVLAACFDRQHPPPLLSDYETLLKESAEMAWISTEGNAFNHATSRVADVQQLNAEQKALGRPIKEQVEISQSGRIQQTAFLAAREPRPFRAEDGTIVKREVPGSFYEFITRLPVDDSPKLDLGFDSSNAQAIFKMTGATK